jgi:uncharacterized protein (DUF302 family)
MHSTLGILAAVTLLAGCATQPDRAAFMTGNGIIDLPSKYSVAETVNRLESLLKSKGIKVFARIDQAAEAKAVGLSMRPTELLIFGDPRVGTPVMEKYPSIAIDLPLKALAWESSDGRVWLSYNSSEYLMERHQLPSPPFKAVEELFRAATQGT